MGVIRCDLRCCLQWRERLLRAFRHVLLLDLSVLDVNSKFAIPYHVFPVFYGLALHFPTSFVTF